MNSPTNNYTIPKKYHTSTSNTQARPGSNATWSIFRAGPNQTKDQSSCTWAIKDPSKCSIAMRDGTTIMSPNNSKDYSSIQNIDISEKAGLLGTKIVQWALRTWPILPPKKQWWILLSSSNSSKKHTARIVQSGFSVAATEVCWLPGCAWNIQTLLI